MKILETKSGFETEVNGIILSINPYTFKLRAGKSGGIQSDKIMSLIKEYENKPSITEEVRDFSLTNPYSESEKELIADRVNEAKEMLLELATKISEI